MPILGSGRKFAPVLVPEYYLTLTRKNRAELDGVIGYGEIAPGIFVYDSDRLPAACNTPSRQISCTWLLESTIESVTGGTFVITI